MKNKIFFILGAIALTASLQAQEYNTYDCDKQQWCCEIVEETCHDYYFEVRGAAFLATNKHFRKVYSTSVPTVQIEGGLTLKNNLLTCDDSLLFWGNVSWSHEKGKTRGWGYPTKFTLIPYSFGLEYQFNLLCDLDLYIGVGPSYSVLRIKNSDCFESNHSRRYHWGVMSKTGVRYSVCRDVFVDVFADYFHTQFRKIHHESIQHIRSNIGGFFVGGGLGVKW